MHVRRMLRLAAIPLASIMLACYAGPANAFEWKALDPNYEPTWDKIKRTGVLLTGCMQQPPYWWKSGTDSWAGYGIPAAENMAKTLGVDWKCVETTWGSAALEIQSGKVDVLLFMNATPKRAMAITFAGPIYKAPFVMINAKNFHAKNWEDYNKPEVKLGVQMGTAGAQVRKVFLPLATTIELQNESELNLAVTAGRADAMITYVVNALLATVKNPNLGTVVSPQPPAVFPAYAGIRNEPDKRFADFVHWWAEWNRVQGITESWVKKAFLELGVKAEDVERVMKLN